MSVRWENTLTPGLEALKKRLAEGEHMVKIGLPDAVKVTRDGKSEALDLGEIALVNEFGSKDGHIPERPAWRQGLGGGAKDFNRLNAVSMRLIALGKMTLEKALGLLGLMGVAKVKTEITDGSFVENAQVTKDRKKSSHPLIDMGQEKNSVTFLVVS